MPPGLFLSPGIGGAWRGSLLCERLFPEMVARTLAYPILFPSSFSPTTGLRSWRRPICGVLGIELSHRSLGSGGSIEAGSEEAGVSSGMVAKHREAPLPASSGTEWVSQGQLQEQGLCLLPHASQWQLPGLLLA